MFRLPREKRTAWIDDDDDDEPKKSEVKNVEALLEIRTGWRLGAAVVPNCFTPTTDSATPISARVEVEPDAAEYILHDPVVSAAFVMAKPQTRQASVLKQRSAQAARSFMDDVVVEKGATVDDAASNPTERVVCL